MASCRSEVIPKIMSKLISPGRTERPRRAVIQNYPTKMKTGDYKLWRSPLVCWWLFLLFSVLTIAFQIIDVKPYPNRERDSLINTAVCGGLAVAFLLLGIRANRQKNTDDEAKSIH
jgi:hypothetical protein